jgi:hypothetical protein
MINSLLNSESLYKTVDALARHDGCGIECICQYNMLGIAPNGFLSRTIIFSHLGTPVPNNSIEKFMTLHLPYLIVDDLKCHISLRSTRSLF